MTYADFRDQVLQHAHNGSRIAASAPPAGFADERANKVIAACALVLQERGVEWAFANQREFFELVKNNLGTWISLVLTVASLFGGGPWLLLLRWIVPAVIDWIILQRQVAGSYGLGSVNANFAAMRADAETVLRS